MTLRQKNDEPVSIALINLGCDKNRYDGEVALGILDEAGYQIVSFEEAQVLLINTCAFIQDAKEESIESILAALAYKKTGKCRVLIAAGCLAQRYAKELLAEIPELDGVVGTGRIGEIASIVQQVLQGDRLEQVGSPGYLKSAASPRILTDFPFTAYLKIAEGCDNCCTYCVIPSLRGAYKSQNKFILLNEARDLVNSGVRELILVAQDTAAYGLDQKENLIVLLESLVQTPNLQWLRLLYCYPGDLIFELANLMQKEPRLCRYLDMPMQHASNRILKRMGRPTTQEKHAKLIKYLRDTVPGITLRSTFMVGFPGETEEDYLCLLQFLEDMQLDRAGFFIYSAEEGTPAALMPDQVPEAVKRERWEQATALQYSIAAKLSARRIGTEMWVLVEGRSSEDQYYGRAESDAPEIDGQVHINTERELLPGELVRARISKAAAYDLWGDLV